jgi:hypothetical protein
MQACIGWLVLAAIVVVLTLVSKNKVSLGTTALQLHLLPIWITASVLLNCAQLVSLKSYAAYASRQFKLLIYIQLCCYACPSACA